MKPDTEPKWRVEGKVEFVGPYGEYSRESWNVTDGETEFSCNTESRADWLCGVLSKSGDLDDRIASLVGELADRYERLSEHRDKGNDFQQGFKSALYDVSKDLRAMLATWHGS